MAGSISTLGIGSGLQLQDILDKLRAVDQQVVDRKKTSITKYQSQLDEFTVVKNKLLTLKSAALNLSLSSSFTGRTVSSSSESVATATASDGATVKNSALTVTNLAQKSNWMSSSGVTSSDSIIYVPTSQVSSGVTDPVTGSIASAPGQLTIAFGASSTITVDVDSGTMLDDSGASGLSLVDLINNDLENAGKITASTYTVGSETFLRVETATPGGSGESNRIAISTNDTTLTFTPPNKLLTIQSGGKATSLSVAADTTLSQLVTQINNDTTNPGITASTINDGIDPANPYKLILTATSFGEEKRITFLTQLPDLAMAEQASQAVANSLNSQFTTDGIAYQRQTNSINDVITGVSLNLQGTGSSTITVINNDDAIKEMIASLVTAYNDVVQ
ncbi:MAG: flagellar filament capping protein FliD, partial [Desulfobulbaceae bacterium]|nr:flagellar filament capping protein FliD [Desulfobulbaceae bacterium]